MRGRASLAALALFACLLPALSGAVAPSVRWHTIETPHFRVHFHEGPNMQALAQRTARVCEAAHALLLPRLKWTPARRTEVILTDDVDSANGSAFTLYRPWMRLYAEVPDDQSVLNDFDDHLWNLVVHEYTHVLHLDTVGGLPSVVNGVLGKVLIPNAYVPRWITEGLATYQESNLSNSGRLRSSLFDMWLRASVLEAPFGLDAVSHVPLAWPRGSLAYLYGGFFMAHLESRLGEDGLPEYFRAYGERLIPLTLNDTAREVWERDFPSFYEDWLVETRARIDRQLQPVREAGVTRLRVLTASGFGSDAPHFTPDGERIVYLEAGPDRRPAIRIMKRDGSEDRLVRELWAGGTIDLSPDGKRLALSLPEIWEQYYTFDDLYLLDLESGALERLTHGLRATEPAWSPDGTQLAFVGRSGGGHSYLGVLELSSGRVRSYAESGPERRLYTPVFSPDGRTIVFSQMDGPGRRLVQLDLQGGEARVVLADGAFSLQPTFAGPERLVFTSDRTGIYNLHALELQTGATTQLTNVITGVFKPSISADGRHFAFTHYGASGYDVAVMPAAEAFDGELPPRAPRPAPVYVDDPERTLPVRPYNPLPTLAPLYWLPLLGEDPVGARVGLTTAGADILERHQYFVEASWGLTSREPGAFLSYTNRTFHPGITVYGQTGIAQSPGFRSGLYDRQWAAGGQLRFPFSSLDRFAQLSLGYEYRYFDPQFRSSFRPDQLRPTFPREGSTGTASLGALFSNARGFAHGISLEEGHAVSASLRHSGPWTGGTFTFSSVDAAYQTYLRAPWGEHHVFALRLSGGAALGDIGDRFVFALGGLTIDDPVMQLLLGGGAGSGALRGYPVGAFAGNSFALGTLEYRFPLLVVDQGISTLPFFLRRFHGAVFTDAGAVGEAAFTLGPVKPSVGVELRTEFVLGYALNAQLRLGVARGLAVEGQTSVYLSLGNTF